MQFFNQNINPIKLNPMKNIKAYGTYSATEDLQPMQIERRSVQPKDVEIKILYCGVCHSDIHTARSEWGAAKYPVVPGHETVGEVINIGNEVSNFNIGEFVCVVMVMDSYRHGDC